MDSTTCSARSARLLIAASFSCGALTGCTNASGVGGAREVTIVTGNQQHAVFGRRLGDSLVIRVAGTDGIPLPDVTVSWAVNRGGGTVAPTSTTTDASGIAFAVWTLGSAIGSNAQRASATVAGIAPVSFTATGIDESFVAKMTADAVRPAPVTNVPNAKGEATLTLQGAVLRYVLSVTALSGAATEAHIRGPAGGGDVGNILVTFSPLGTATTGEIGSGTITTPASGVSVDSLLTLMRNGVTYVDIATRNNPGGEVRGQIVAK